MTHKGAKMVAGLFVAALMAAFLLPIAVGAISGPEVVTAEQGAGETIVLEGDLNATVDSLSVDQNATYNVSNDAGSDTVTVSEGSTETATVGDTDVSITLDDAAATTVTTTYEYPMTYGWNSAAASLWVVLPVLMVLAVFLFFVGLAINRA